MGGFRDRRYAELYARWPTQPASHQRLIAQPQSRDLSPPPPPVDTPTPPRAQALQIVEASLNRTRRRVCSWWGVGDNVRIPGHKVVLFYLEHYFTQGGTRGVPIITDRESDVLGQAGRRDRGCPLPDHFYRGSVLSCRVVSSGPAGESSEFESDVSRASEKERERARERERASEREGEGGVRRGLQGLV